jgi:hypothetical protein
MQSMSLRRWRHVYNNITSMPHHNEELAAS